MKLIEIKQPIPVKVDCPDCDGTGEIGSPPADFGKQRMQAEPCETCGGTGWIREVPKKSEAKKVSESTLTEGLWAKTNKYSNDPDLKNGHEWFNLPGVPGGVKALSGLEELLQKSKGKVTPEIIKYAEKNFTTEFAKFGLGVAKWLQWVADNKQRVAQLDGGEYLNY